MRFLVLTSGPPGYKRFFSAIGEALEKRGHEVRFVADGRQTAVLEPDAFVDSRCVYFSEFFRLRRVEFFSEAESLVTAERAPADSWGDYFYADLDRFFWYRVNLGRAPTYWTAVYIALRQFFLEQLAEYSVDAVLYENVSNSFAYAAYLAAQEKGVPYVGLAPARVPGRFEVQTSVKGEAEKLYGIYEELDEETAEDKGWVDDYMANLHCIQPDYMRHNNLGSLAVASKYLNRAKFAKALRVVKAQFLNRDDRDWSYLYGSPLKMSWAMVRRSIARRVREPRIRRFFGESERGQRYYVYPVHFHPESSTSILAPNYTDELNNIINIAFSLPIGTMLYVKEHISAYALQTTEFYRRVSQIPNVKLLRPSVDIKRLMADAEGVITITGTAGFEALLLGRPVYCFGDVFYERLPGVIRVRSFAELAEQIKVKPGPLMAEDVRKVLRAYRWYTWEGRLNMMGFPTAEELYSIRNAIERTVVLESNRSVV